MATTRSVLPLIGRSGLRLEGHASLLIHKEFYVRATVRAARTRAAHLLQRMSPGHSRCASIASPAQCSAVPSAMLSLSAALAPTSNTAVMQNYRQVLMLILLNRCARGVMISALPYSRFSGRKGNEKSCKWQNKINFICTFGFFVVPLQPITDEICKNK